MGRSSHAAVPCDAPECRQRAISDKPQYPFRDADAGAKIGDFPISTDRLLG
jgi:hypothetical protein